MQNDPDPHVTLTLTLTLTLTRTRTLRWAAMLEPQNYIDYEMSGVLQTVFLSGRLSQSTEVTGSAIVEIWISSSTPHRDVDVYAHLVCVRKEDQVARYVTEGVMRASHRVEDREGADSKEWQAQPFPWLPYHAHTLESRNTPITMQTYVTLCKPL